MMLPKNIITTNATRAPKGIVYGPPGSGKTTFGASADRPLIVDCENGANHVRCHRTPYLASWREIEPWLTGLAAGGHEYDTVVIDTIDWLLRRIEEHVAGVDLTATGLNQTLNRSHGGYGAGKQVLKNYVYQWLLPTLDRLVNAGVAVLLLAHAARRSITTIDGIEVEKLAPEIHPDLVNTMIEWADFVGVIQRDGADRVLLLTETATAVAKNRYGVDGAIPLDWPSLTAAVQEGG